MRKRKKIYAALLLVSILLSDAAFSVQTLAAPTSESIEEMEEQIGESRKEKDSLKNSISDLEKIKKELEAQKGDLKNYVEKLDRNVAEMENNIQKLQAEIAGKEEEIVRTQEELAQAQEDRDQQYVSMRTRIRFMYETGAGTSLIEFLFTAGNLSDFLNRTDYISSIYAYDQKMWEEYQLNCEYIALCEEQLKLEKEILDQQKKNVEEEQTRVETLIREKNQEILNYQTDINNKEAAIAEYERDIAEQNEIIAQLEKAVKEAKKKLEEQNQPKYDGGVFTFPLASYTRVSDDYGNRTHPILKVPQFHNGVDFAAPKGTAIYAAYKGQVVASAYSSSMGNYVMIDHGDGLYTIYMHASKLCVSSGVQVSAGEKIAEVGSTGRSTGNHLHFSVRKNGSYVSPWNYIG